MGDCARDLKWWPSEHYWFDNHMVRVILGPKVFALPIGQITDEHARAAIKLLGEFDLVITLESLVNTTAQSSLNALLGWNLHETLPPVVNPTSKKEVFTEEEIRRLRSMLQHDYTLYN